MSKRKRKTKTPARNKRRKTPKDRVLARHPMAFQLLLNQTDVVITSKPGGSLLGKNWTDAARRLERKP